MKSQKELEILFNPVRQPVIVVCDKAVIFSNPSAKAVFGNDLDLKKPEDIFPSELLNTAEEGCVAAGDVLGMYSSISAARLENLKIFFLCPISMDADALRLTRHMVSSMRSSAMGLKMAADRFLGESDAEQVSDERFVAAFYHYYYNLSRTLSQIDSADLIKRTELPFSPAPTDLVQLCRDLADTVSLLCSDRGIDISFATLETDLMIMADAEKLETLILNLFSNSLHHTQSGSSITLGLSRSGDSIIISMDDNGEGMSEETLQKLFILPDNDFCMSDSNTGIGLGIYISLGIAKLHGGTLIVESRQGEGTHFRVTLPYAGIPEGRLGVPRSAYHTSGMSPVLTELADVLSSKCFGPKYQD